MTHKINGPIVDVPSKFETILSNNKLKIELEDTSKVLLQACINKANISQDTENVTTSTLCKQKNVL